jgi:hypothetical protein
LYALQETLLRIKIVGDGIIKTDGIVKSVQDGIIKTDSIVKSVQDSIVKTGCILKSIQDGIDKTDAIVKSVQDSIVKTDEVVKPFCFSQLSHFLQKRRDIFAHNKISTLECQRIINYTTFYTA